MNIKNLKSNPYYHFVEVEGTETEFSECNTWCTEQFGNIHSHGWAMELISGPVSSSDIVAKLRNRVNGLEQLYVRRYRFPNPAQRDWFILRWS